VSGKLEKMRKEAVVVYFKVLFWHEGMRNTMKTFNQNVRSTTNPNPVTAHF